MDRVTATALFVAGFVITAVALMAVSVYGFDQYERAWGRGNSFQVVLWIIIAAGVPTSLVAGARSDRLGRKRLVYLSGGVMALASIVFIGVALSPSLPFMFAVGALFGLGYGAYLAVDWALAVDVLPRGEAAAKDMGIWHVSMVLPQVFAPAITGFTLTALKPKGLLLGYGIVFVMTALWFVLGTVFVRAIKGVR